MTNEHESLPPMFRIDVTPDAATAPPDHEPDTGEALVGLMRRMLLAQERSNQLLEELIQHLGAPHRQRLAELGQWRDAHPDLARSCRLAAETLSRVQAQFLHNLTDEIRQSEDCLIDGDFMLNEFVDRYGPRLAHLNGVLQVLSQLSAVPATSHASQ